MQFRREFLRFWASAFFIFSFIPVMSFAQQPGEAELLKLMQAGFEQIQTGKIEEGKKTAASIQALIDRSFPQTSGNRAAALLQLFIMKTAFGEYDDAEKLGLSVAEMCKTLPGAEPLDAVVHQKLGELYGTLGRITDSEREYIKAYNLATQHKLPEYPLVTGGALRLASVYNSQSRYTEAETWSRYSMSLLKKYMEEDNPEYQQVVGILCTSLEGQNRRTESEQLRRQILSTAEKKFGKGDFRTAVPLKELGIFYMVQHRTEEATSCLKDALAIFEKHDPDAVGCADIHFSLAVIYLTENMNPDAAKPHFERSQELARKHFGENNPYATMGTYFLWAESAANILKTGDFSDSSLKRQADRWHDTQLSLQAEIQSKGETNPEILGQILLQLEWPLIILDWNSRSGIAISPEMQATLDQLPIDAILLQATTIVEMHEDHPTIKAYLSSYYETKAHVAWRKNERDAALADLRKAMDLTDQSQSFVPGIEQDRARNFAKHARPFHLMIAWQAELGEEANIELAFNAAERSTARTLMTQLDLRGVELLKNVPEAEAKKLRARLFESQSNAQQIQVRMSQAGLRKDLSDSERLELVKVEGEKLTTAQAAVFNAMRDIRNASPDYQFAVRKNRLPMEWKELQARLKEHNALWMQYVESDIGTFLVISRPDGTGSVSELKFSDSDLSAAAIAKRGVFGTQLHELLQGRGKESLLEYLRSPESATANQSMLHLMWTVLIPESERVALQNGTYQQLIVAPDSELSSLPFEALVVTQGESPQYLLDIGPPIAYVPSATVWANLEDRSGGSDTTKSLSVMTVGHPTHSMPGESDDFLSLASTRSAWKSLSGSLTALPYSEKESTWVRDVFQDNKISVRQLLATQATEEEVRKRISGQHIVHFACHGLIDRSYGNLFGGLALTSPQKATSSANDGFLTLAEMYELNLDGCQLAVLSACDTNVGPNQKGEGVWAMSRGMLVAGAERVVATNWLVNDEAAANLVSYFCGGVAADMASDTTQYAKRLQQAKRWLRKDPRWSSPYYWAPFVMIGPP